MEQFKQMLESHGSEENPPFKVQVNFDIPTFQGKIDEDVVDDWLLKLERYFSVDQFSNEEKINFSLLKTEGHVKHSWEAKVSSKELQTRNTFFFHQKPTWGEFVEHIKEEYFPADTYKHKNMQWQLL